MRFTNLVIFKAFAIYVLNLSPEMEVRAGYPAEQFDELNTTNKNQRNLGGGDFMPLAAEGEVTLLVRTTTKEGDEKACKKGRDGRAEQHMDKLHLLAINVPAQDVEATIEELNKQSGIESVELDHEVHALPAFRDKDDVATLSKGIRSGSRKLAESTPYGIQMVKSKNVITKGQGMITSPRKICVVDTGYALGHPDLPNNPSSGVTGFSPYGDGELWNVDGHSHGTHCAGTIGALGNGIGVVGGESRV